MIYPKHSPQQVHRLGTPQVLVIGIHKLLQGYLSVVLILQVLHNSSLRFQPVFRNVSNLSTFQYNYIYEYLF